MIDPPGRPQLDRGFQARLRELYMERDALCPRCRYHLRGVPGPLCPECGTDVSDHLRIADTTAWRLHRMRVRWLVRRAALWAALVAVLISCIAATVLLP